MESTKALSFATDIRPMFTDVDVDHMRTYGLDLSLHDSVAKGSAQILSVVRSGAMPPAAENRAWTKDMCDTFDAWMRQGCPP
jgi:hypothetical protein